MDNLIMWSPGITLEAIEKQVILAAFRHFKGNHTMTSNALGITAKTLYNKFEKYAEDAKIEKEIQDAEQRKREDFARRARGNVPNNIYTGQASGESSANVSGSAAGVRVEPASGSESQPSLSMPERAKVQSVLPGPVAGNRSSGRR